MKILLISAALLAISHAAKTQQRAPPVAILKQIDKHNEDGSYSYGYEAEDGTFKIETKYPDGQVYGKYGYVDDTGALREVEYGASKRGFEPSGSEIQVAPPTLRNQQASVRPLGPEEEDDGQYREDPSVYYQNEPGARAQAQAQPQRRPQPASRYQQPQSVYSQPQYEPEPEPYRPAYRPKPAYRPESVYRPEPEYRPEPAYKPAYRPQSAFKSYYVQEEPAYEPAYEPEYRPEPPRSYQPQPQAYRPQSNFGFSNDNNNNWNNQPQPSYSSYNSQNSNGPSWAGHPASNVDIWTGSYSVNYK